MFMKLRTLFFVFIAAVALASCGNKGGKTGLLVPKDAFMVVHINGASLSSKLSWQEIQQSQWYQAVQKKLQTEEHADSVAMKIFENPEASGVDTKSDMVYYLVSRAKKLLLVVNGKLGDATKFENFLKQVGNTSAPVVKDGVSSVSIQDRSVVIWDKNHWLALTTMPAGELLTQGDDFGMRDVTVSTDTLRGYGQDLLAVKGSKLLDADKRFADLVTDGKDLHVWFNTETYFKLAMNGRMSMASMFANIGDIVKDNIATYSVDFGNGKITADSRHYYGDKMSSLFKKYEGKPVTAEKAELLPDDVVMAAAINYQPAFFKELINTLGLDGIVNALTAQAGFSIDDFVKANAGDVLFAMSNFQGKSAADSAANDKPDSDITFGVSVKDKAAFDNLITLLWQRSHSKENALTYKLENNWFAASTQPANVERILSGKGSKSAYTDKIIGHPLGLYLNVQRFIEEGSKQSTDTTATKVAALASSTLRELLVNGGEFTKNYMSMHAELTLADPTTNSLKQLNTLLDSIYVNSKDRIEELQAKMDEQKALSRIPLDEEVPLTEQKNK